jgi:hypothetical protein
MHETTFPCKETVTLPPALTVEAAMPSAAMSEVVTSITFGTGTVESSLTKVFAVTPPVPTV